MPLQALGRSRSKALQVQGKIEPVNATSSSGQDRAGQCWEVLPDSSYIQSRTSFLKAYNHYATAASDERIIGKFIQSLGLGEGLSVSPRRLG